MKQIQYGAILVALCVIVSHTFAGPVMCAAQDIVAHRGASHDAPENTLAAFELAWQQGADVIEGDFYLTSDGQIACHHDRSTKKTTGVDLMIAETTFDRLQQLDVGSWKGETWAGERMPSLADVFATVPEGKRILVEVKCGPEITQPLKQAVQECNLAPEQITIIAFDAKVIASCKEAMPKIKGYWLTSFEEDDAKTSWSPTLPQVLQTLERCNADGLDCRANLEVLDAQFVKGIRDAEYELHCWTVNDPAVAKALMELGVDSITTDRPRWLREQVASER